ncbi:MAG TPA: glutamine synthetase family protein [Candidatus Binataceae bacterium]|nr:glutamine synthetase family protein [Candidatus Binataceae bacterium]
MQREPIVFAGTSDLSAHFRGKSFPAADLPSRLQNGIGLAPANIFLSAFGPIQVNPFGSRGEVVLMPDPDTRTLVTFEGGPAEHFFLADIRTLEGAPWDFCPRHVLRRALERLHSETGLRMLASFEQEFTYSAVAANPPQPYELDAYRRQGLFGETLLGAMREAGLTPDAFLSEYGPQQYEVTAAPALGLRAADDAVIVRELAHAVAFRLGQRVSFAPIHDPDGVGNGTHIHFSFLDREGQPVLYDEQREWQLSALGSHFVAGILHYLPAMCGITAASVASYYRLRPNRWAPVKPDAGPLDRGAAVRIAPVFSSDPEKRGRQFNFEFRVADATANPYLALAIVIQAGLDGIRHQRRIEATDERSLPTSLTEALTLLEASDAVGEWLGADLRSGYVLFKRAEIEGLRELDESEICRRYAEVY